MESFAAVKRKYKHLPIHEQIKIGLFFAKKKLTQRALAARLNVSEGLISKTLKGERPKLLKVIAEIVEGLY